MLAGIVGIVLTALLTMLNLRGVKEPARLNIGFAVIDLVMQGLLVLFGISLILGGWRHLLQYPKMGPEYWPGPRQLVFAVAIAMVAYVGLESAAQMAEETKTPTRTVPRALFWSVLTVIFMFAALPIVALSGIDLILLGAQRNGVRSRDAVVYGATADYVVRNAPCAVWTVRAERKTLAHLASSADSPRRE